MHSIILGANGMMGSMMSFVANMHQIPVQALGRNEFNVFNDSIETLEKFCENCVCIVNCIGAIPQKKYSDTEMKQLNEVFPHTLAKFCKERNIPLIHLSTNCVFSGKHPNCKETDEKDAEDTYGASKAAGEPTYGLVLRSSIIGPEKNTAFGLMEWYLQNSETEVSGYTDHVWNGVTTLELSKFIFGVIEYGKIPYSAIWHIYSSNSVSKYTLLCDMKAIFQKGPCIQKVSKGVKHYTLSSDIHGPRKTIREQLEDLMSLYSLFKENI